MLVSSVAMLVCSPDCVVKFGPEIDAWTVGRFSTTSGAGSLVLLVVDKPNEQSAYLFSQL
jgi:hypothetical protein